jgi:hypothetical protein
MEVTSLDKPLLRIFASKTLLVVFVCLPSAAVLYYAGLYYDHSDLLLLAYLSGIIGTVNLYLHIRIKRDKKSTSLGPDSNNL